MDSEIAAVTSILLSGEAAYFFARSGVGLSPKVIASLATTKWDYNSDAARSMCEQTGNSKVGVLLLIGAIAIGMAGIMVEFPVENTTGLAVSFTIVGSAHLIGGFASRRITKRYVSTIRALLGAPAE